MKLYLDEMKKIKVYLQKPWKLSEDSQYYKLLKENPPNGIEYISFSKRSLLQKGKSVFIFDLVKRVIRRIVKLFYSSMPNANYDSEGDKYDLIHCMRCMSKNKKPWICDIEFPGGFWITTYPKYGEARKSVLEYLQSPYCKKIMPWTKWCADKITELFPEIRDKVEVVYPAIESKKFKKIKTGKMVLLYVSRRFYFKGGLYALEVMDRVTKENESVEGWIVSDVPDEIYKKYRDNKNIKFLGTLTQKELFARIYPSADIFLYPSFTDTFGYVILEAMSFGLPVISVGGLSRKEIVENGKTGVLIKELKEDFDPEILEKLDREISKEILIATRKLLKDGRGIEKMSKNCIRVVKTGKFSINERNKKLRKIIEEALE
jgi:glycosyltransferase involved in cell wall biosynthesis